MGKQRKKVQLIEERLVPIRLVDCEALARDLVSRGLASVSVLESVWFGSGESDTRFPGRVDR